MIHLFLIFLLLGVSFSCSCNVSIYIAYPCKFIIEFNNSDYKLVNEILNKNKFRVVENYTKRNKSSLILILEDCNLLKNGPINLSSKGSICISSWKSVGFIGNISYDKKEKTYKVFGNSFYYYFKKEFFVYLLTYLTIYFLLSIAISYLFKRNFLKDELNDSIKIKNFIIFESLVIPMLFLISMVVGTVLDIFAPFMLISFLLFKDFESLGVVTTFILILVSLLSPLFFSYKVCVKEISRTIKLRRKVKIGDFILGTIIGFSPYIFWMILVTSLPKSIVENNLLMLIIFFIFLLIVFSLFPFILSFDKKYPPPENIKRRIEGLCKKLNIKIKEIVVVEPYMDVANAAITGILPFSRVLILTKPLIEKFSEEEIEAIVAHEIGHIKNKDLWKLLIFSFFWAVVWFCISKIFNINSFERFIIIFLPAFILYFVIIGAFIHKKSEMEADLFAAKLVGLEVYKKALIKLAEVNKLPKRGGKSWLFLTFHPSIEDRIKYIEEKLKFKD